VRAALVGAALVEALGRPRSKRVRLALTFGSTAVAAVVFLAFIGGFQHFFDLGVYRGAVRYWLHDDGDLYAFRYDGSDYGFTYPPFAAIVLSPLAVIPWPVAVVLAIAANIGAVVLLLWLFLAPVLRRRSWPVWAGCALAFCALLLFEPVRATFKSGQINLLLLSLVCLDRRLLQAGRQGQPGRRAGIGRVGRWAGIGIGVAAAIKLVPAVFVGYLIFSRQFRAALVAIGTAVTVTLLAFAVAPGASRTFWTDAVWDTDRVGQLAVLSNQSLRGVVARLDVSDLWWLAAVGVVVVIWFVKVRRDADAGFAVTGVVGCLASPVTWIHHLVWLLPALFGLFETAVAGSGPQRRRRATAAVLVAYLLLSLELTWVPGSGTPGWPGFVGSNLYVWVCLGLLVMLPVPVRASAVVVPRPRRPRPSRDAADSRTVREGLKP
jgi:alpha-1,2-mannosyltransferase